jgi:hypothetical protein
MYRPRRPNATRARTSHKCYFVTQTDPIATNDTIGPCRSCLRPVATDWTVPQADRGSQGPTLLSIEAIERAIGERIVVADSLASNG